MLDIFLSSLLNLAVIIPQNSGMVDCGFEATFITKQIINPLPPVLKDQHHQARSNDPIVPPN